MQAIKDKFSHKTAEAKAEEKAEKDLAKAKMEVAHEARLARESEAAMELHITKARELAQQEKAMQANSIHTTSQNSTYKDPNEYPRR